VPLEVAGLPVGVKESGGILEHPVREVTVSCLPASIPEKIVVDVSNLGINQSIHIRDVHVEGVDILNSPEEVVAVVSIPKAEVVAEPTAAEAAVEGAVPAEGAEGAVPAEGAEGGAQPQPDGKAEKGAKPEKAGKPEKADKGEKKDKKERK
jgi:large subunit ribosomal protein L25